MGAQNKQQKQYEIKAEAALTHFITFRGNNLLIFKKLEKIISSSKR